jgi:molybdopterin synthase catalytic subunit
MAGADICLTHDPITDPPALFAEGQGAEARFLGVVRGVEDGRAISGIEYSAYEVMAEQMMAALYERAREVHGAEHEVHIRHQLGFVAAGLPSIVIRVRTKHSAAAFDLCRWYLAEIKTTVPIWKRPVWLDS